RRVRIARACPGSVNRPLQSNLKLPQVRRRLLKLTKWIRGTYCQGSRLGRREWTETGTPLIDHKIGIADEFWPRLHHAPTIPCPLGSGVVLHQENESWHEGKASWK